MFVKQHQVHKTKWYRIKHFVEWQYFRPTVGLYQCLIKINILKLTKYFILYFDITNGMSDLNNFLYYFLLTWAVWPSEVFSSFGVCHSPYTFLLFQNKAVEPSSSRRVSISCYSVKNKSEKVGLLLRQREHISFHFYDRYSVRFRKVNISKWWLNNN